MLNIKIRNKPKLIYIILVVFLLKQILYMFIIPIWQGPDEMGHFDYVQRLAEKREIPNLKSAFFSERVSESITIFDFDRLYSREVVSDSDKAKLKSLDNGSLNDSNRPNWIFQHAPLYYLVLIPFYFLAKPFGFIAQIYLLRFISIILGALTIFLVHKTVQLIVPKRIIFHNYAPLFLAFIPQFSFINATINNDNLTTLLGTLILFFMVKFMTEKPNYKQGILLGGLTGLILATKLTALPFILIISSYEIIRILVHKNNLKVILKVILLEIIIIFGLAFPWYLRNYQVYGNFYATYKTVNLVHTEKIHPDLTITKYLFQTKFIPTYFRRFWDINSWRVLFAKPIFIIFFQLIFILSLAGWIRFYRSRQNYRDWQLLGLLALFLSLLLHIGVVVWKLYDSAKYSNGLPAIQIRYIYPVISPIVLYFSGWLLLIKNKYAKLNQNYILALVLIFMFSFETNLMLSQFVGRYYIKG